MANPPRLAGPTATGLRALREQFRASLPAVVEAFRALAAELAARPDDLDALVELRRALHRMHGAAGSYGFRRASVLAARLEAEALRWAAEPALERERRGAIVEEFVAALSGAFETPETQGDADEALAGFGATHAPAGIDATELGDATVLALDDDPVTLLLLRSVLEASGIRVVTLADPARLLEVLAEVRPALLMMDVNMGAVDGLALTRALRAMPAHAALPVVLLSATSDPGALDRARAAGADEFIPKPVARDELRSRVASCLERASRSARDPSGVRAKA